MTNDGQPAIKMYAEQGITFLGIKLLKVRVLFMEDPNQVLGKKCQTKLSGIAEWNVIQLSYHAFVEKYGLSGLDSFECTQGVNPLPFP